MVDPFLQQLRNANPGSLRMPQPLGAKLLELRKKRVGRASTRLDRARRAWERSMPKEILEATAVASFKDGELTVTSTSQALLHELSTFRSREIVGLVNQQLAEIDQVVRLRVKAAGRRRTAAK